MKFLESQRTDNAYETLYKHILDFSDLTDDPRYSKRPRRYDDGEVSHRFECSETYFKQLYFEAIYLCHGELSNGISETRLNCMPVAAAIEKVLVDAVDGTLENSKVPEVLTLYTKFFDIPHLSIQLKMIPDLVKAYNEENQPICIVTNVCTICEILISVSSSKTMFKQVCNLIKVLLPMPVTTATTERSFSTLRQLKIFCRELSTDWFLKHFNKSKNSIYKYSIKTIIHDY